MNSPLASLVCVLGAMAIAPAREEQDPIARAHERLSLALEQARADILLALTPKALVPEGEVESWLDRWRSRLEPWKEGLADPWLALQQHVFSNPPRFEARSTDLLEFAWAMERRLPAVDSDELANALLLTAFEWEVEGGDLVLRDLHSRYVPNGADRSLPPLLRARSFEEVMRSGAPATMETLPDPAPIERSLPKLDFDPGAAVAACLRAMKEGNGPELERLSSWRPRSGLGQAGDPHFERMKSVVAEFERVRERFSAWRKVADVDPQVRRLRFDIRTTSGREQVEFEVTGAGKVRLVSALLESAGQPTLVFPGPLRAFLEESPAR